MMRGGTLRHFYAYGGPQAGMLIGVKPGATTYSHWERSGPKVRRYPYVLVDVPGGGSALATECDEDLRSAYYSASGEPGDRETDTLNVEIQRRGLDL
jgi:hypothetical protein